MAVMDIYGNKPSLLLHPWGQSRKTWDSSRRGVLLGQQAAPSRSPAASLPDHTMATVVTVCWNAQLAPSPPSDAHSFEIFISAPWETLNCSKPL